LYLALSGIESGIIKTNYFFHLVLVDQTRPDQIRPDHATYYT
jgi:hypothetical protein